MKVLITTAALFLHYVYGFRSSIRAVKCALYTYYIKKTLMGKDQRMKYFG